MKNTPTTAALLKSAPHALQALHAALGMDFEKPFTAVLISGPFTINRCMKYVSDFDAVVAIISRTGPGFCCPNEYRLATIDGGVLNVEVRAPWGLGIDYFYSKTDFNDRRKSQNAETYVIAQRREYLNPAAPFTPDYNARHDFVADRYYHRRVGGPAYLSEITVRQAGNPSAPTFTVKTGNEYNYNCDDMTVSDMIDKSGYLLSHRRFERLQRARRLRADRAKAAYNATDNADKVAELSRLISARKSAIMAAFSAATTGADFDAVCNMLGRYYNGFVGAVNAFERFKTATAARAYKSIADSDAAYNDIKKRLSVEV